MIREELGEYPETLWRSFDPEAIASASLAQVHRAEGWNGEQLAVKVRFSRGTEGKGAEGTGSREKKAELVAGLTGGEQERWSVKVDVCAECVLPGNCFFVTVEVFGSERTPGQAGRRKERRRSWL